MVAPGAGSAERKAICVGPVCVPGTTPPVSTVGVGAGGEVLPIGRPPSQQPAAKSAAITRNGTEAALRIEATLRSEKRSIPGDGDSGPTGVSGPPQRGRLNPTVTRLPSLAAHTRPPWASARCFTIARPRPVPPVTRWRDGSVR